MKKEEALQAILRECLKLPESKRNTPDKVAIFAVGIMKTHPHLTKFRAKGDRYQHINAYLVHNLLQKKQ
jgi:hypothetical protein